MKYNILFHPGFTKAYLSLPIKVHDKKITRLSSNSLNYSGRLVESCSCIAISLILRLSWSHRDKYTRTLPRTYTQLCTQFTSSHILPWMATLSKAQKINARSVDMFTQFKFPKLRLHETSLHIYLFIL